MSDERPRPSEFGSTDDAPPVDEKPYKIIFEANKCFGAGKCAEVAENWEMDVISGIAKPKTYYIGEDELADRREESAGKAHDFADTILGFYHVYVALARDERLDVPCKPDAWCFDEEFSAWMIEQMIRHHERDFGVFERIEDTPEEFYDAHGVEMDD